MNETVSGKATPKNKALMKWISLAVFPKSNRNNLCELFETMPEKEELVNTFSLFFFFCNKWHIFVIEEEPLSRVCRQLHQMMPCMKSQLLVIDKFPNTSKDFSNYLSPLLKLNSCISFPTSLFFKGMCERVCVIVQEQAEKYAWERWKRRRRRRGEWM